MSRSLRLRIFWLAAAVLGVLAASGCGRSDLGLYVWGDGGFPDGGGDAQPDGGGCDAASCPTGCCDPSGTCRTGTELNACGFGGVSCTDCQKAGFELCDPKAHSCANVNPTCNPTNCAQGCCTSFNGQLACVSGLSSLACGGGGQQCVDCTQSGELCNAATRTCQQAPCGPNNCKGCCSGGTCVSSESNTQCGLGGLSCMDCSAQGAVCNAGSGQCVPIQPQCNASNCKGCCAGTTCISNESNTQCGLGGVACTNCSAQGAVCNAGSGQCVIQPLCNASNCSGCCAGNVCVTSQSNTQCGLGGVACVNCSQSGAVCQNGTCATPCTAANCPGCCQAGTCFAGFLDSRCGSGGAACLDCTATNSTCDTLVTPRTCNAQSACPQPYPGCASSVTTPVLSQSPGMCSASDLQDAKAACSAGYTSIACQSYFAALGQIHATCAKCLMPFEYDLQDAVGIFNCVSPFVSSSCNHATGCVSNCETQSCAQCPSGAQSQCYTQVLQGQCQSYLLGTQCAGQALFGGPGAFCNPQPYQGNYGAWLAGVGAHYCQ